MRAKKRNAKIASYILLFAILFTLAVAFKGSWRGYDEYREEQYQYYTFVYSNNSLIEIRVKPRVFNVLCDKNNETAHICSITNKQHMREFKELVNR